MVGNSVTKIPMLRDPYKLDMHFYTEYDVDHWLYKILTLKNVHDHYDESKAFIHLGMDDVSEDHYKRAIRAEMHFLYFQMVETLFQMIFSLHKCDGMNLWLAISLSHDKKSVFRTYTYSMISDFSNNSLDDCDLWAMYRFEYENKILEIPFIRWVFYEKMITDNNNQPDDFWDKNLKNIERMLKLFSRDFSDRTEYNAYKHSLRIFSGRLKLEVFPKGEKPYCMGESEDAIHYLEESKKNREEDKHEMVLTSKPFSFERDTKFCIHIYELLSNIVKIRKHIFLNKLGADEFPPIYSFQNVNVDQISSAKTSLIKFSRSV